MSNILGGGVIAICLKVEEAGEYTTRWESVKSSIFTVGFDIANMK